MKLLLISFLLMGCGSFQAQRVDNETSDEKSLGITDEWNATDTEKVIAEVIEQLKNHQGFQRYLRENRRPALFVGEVQNLTAEAYFPINDINDAFLNELSQMGDFVLVDEAARDLILNEIQYQNDGMVDPTTAKNIGKQTGADLIIFGNVHMRPASRDGRTIKEYALNLRMTDIEKGVEVLRTRVRNNKFSKKSRLGW
jgi:penicillin-binding protein activator